MISKIYYNIVLVLFCLLFCAFQSSGQSGIIIRGKVTLEQTGKAIPGVTVFEKNKDNRIVSGVVTDGNGVYQIRIVNVNDSIYYSQIGLKTEARLIGTNKVIDIAMVDAVQEIEEISVTARRAVSTGGFLSIAPRDMTAAVASVEMSEIEEIPASSLDQILEGQVSGLLISMNSGDPGSGSAIQIRGATSLGLGSKPLIVVDDVPFHTNEEIDLNNPDGLSELVNISPSDVASIDVLKDAAATALYGADGANGVIVIKTKRGDNVKPRVNVTSRFTFKVPQRPLPLLNGDQYKTMILEAYQHRYGTTVDLTNSSIRNLFLEKGALDYENYNNNTYWPDEVNMERGFAQNYTGSIIGGGESAKYNISLGYLDEKGPNIGTKFNRLNGRFNFDYKISDRLTFNSDFSYSSSTIYSSYENIGAISLVKTPIVPIYTQDLYGNSLSSFFFPGKEGFQNNIKNPVALARNASSINRSNRLDAKLQMRFNPLDGLQINSLVSMSYESLDKNKFLPHSATGDDYYRENNYYLIVNSNVNKAYVSPKSAFNMYVKNDFIYRRNIGKHTLMSALYTVYQDNSTRLIELEGNNTPSEILSSPYLTDIHSKISSKITLKRDFSVIGQLYYLYGDRYALSGSLRRQGNSAFGKNNRYGVFPSISGFWRPSSEPLFKEQLSMFDEFKVRFSHGTTGRAPKESAANAFTYSANAPFIDIIGITADNIELFDLKWEKTTSTDLGLDLSVLKGRLTFNGDVSRLKTRDLILDVPISNSSGFETITRNFGTIKGQIFELAFTGVPIKSENWDLRISFNASRSDSKVVELPNNEPVVRDNVLGNGRYLSLVNVGGRIGDIYGLKYEGVYAYDEDAFVKNDAGDLVYDLNGNKVPIRWMSSEGEAFSGGDAKYADLNKDGIIDKQDVTAIGNTNPDLYGGFMFRLKYKRTWELFANFTYQVGFDIINQAKMNTTNMYTYNNQSTAVLKRWRKQGDVTDMPRALYGTGQNWVGSDRYVEDGSYVKFSTLSISYNLNREMLDKLKFKSAKIALSVYNLGLLTKYSGVDPSISMNRNDPFKVGVDKSLTPIPITYTIGAWLNF